MPTAPNAAAPTAAYHPSKYFYNSLCQQPQQQQTNQAHQQQQQAVAAAVANMTAGGIQPNSAAFLNPYQGLLTTPQNLMLAGQFNLNQQQQAVAAQAAVLQAAAQQIQQTHQLHTVGTTLANGLFGAPVPSLPIQTKVPLLRTPRMITKVSLSPSVCTLLLHSIELLAPY